MQVKLQRETKMRSLLGSILGLCLFGASAAYAASSANPVEVSATVVTNCQITVSDLAFGAYDPLGSHANQQLDGTADVQVLCTRSASASIALEAGSGSRTLASSNTGSERVMYQIYRDSNRTRAWSGDSTNNIHLVSRSAREPQQFTVYARIPAGQQVSSGRYTDVVRATVYF
jgi:spore coat protein U-like protein